MFENLDVSPRSRFYRRLVIVLVTLALLVLSFAAITAISVLKVRLSMSTAMDPRALALDIGGEGGGAFGTTASRAAGGETPDAITLRDDFDGTTAFRPVCEPELALCESAYSDSGLLSVMRWGAPLDVVSVVSPMSESEKLVKVKSLMKEIAACARDPRGCSAARGEAAQKTRKCHACYCAGLQYARFPTSTETHRAGDLVVSAMTDKEVADLREQCDAFLTEPGSLERGLLFLAVAAVTIVNSGLKMIVQAVSAFERPDSFIELQKNIAEKVFAAQFFNTAVSSLVINAALPELVRGVPLLDGAVFNGVHRDFDQRWYESIGGPLMVTMFVNTVGPVGGNLAAELLGGVNRFLGRMTAWTQHALDASYLGPEFDIATRYGEVLMCVTVTMMYGSGMPLLYAFACFFCVTIAYFDKRHLLRVCRRPPRYGTSLAFLALAVVPWSGFVHLLFGMWMHTHFLTPSVASAAGGGYGDVFGEDPYDAAIAKNATRDAFASVLAQGASLEEILAIAKNASETAAASRRAGYAPIPDEINRRILQANGFPFFFAALLFLASFIALKILSTFWATFKSVSALFIDAAVLDGGPDVRGRADVRSRAHDGQTRRRAHVRDARHAQVQRLLLREQEPGDDAQEENERRRERRVRGERPEPRRRLRQRYKRRLREPGRHFRAAPLGGDGGRRIGGGLAPGRRVRRGRGRRAQSRVRREPGRRERRFFVFRADRSAG
jgi:hypothetical protein